MNVLVIKELYDEEIVGVYELPDDEDEAIAIAKSMFDRDVEEEKQNSASGIDENNTYWDDKTGQIQWNSLDDRGLYRRATYDVAELHKIK